MAGAWTWARAGVWRGRRPGLGRGCCWGAGLGRGGGMAGAWTWGGMGVRRGRGMGVWQGLRPGLGRGCGWGAGLGRGHGCGVGWEHGSAVGQGLGPGAGWRHGPGAERRAQGRRGVGLTQTVHPQVVPRQPDQSAGRAHADACAPGRGLPGAETERAQLLRHLLPVRGLPWGTGGAAGHPWCRPTDPVWLLCPCQGLRARSSTAASSRRARP